MKKHRFLFFFLCLSLFLTACAAAGDAPTEPPSSGTTAAPETVPAVSSLPAADGDTSLSFSGSGITVSGDGVEISGNQAIISRSGTYLLSGSLSDGQVVVDAKGETVILLLSGLELSCSTGAPIWIQSAETVTITTGAGTSNTLSNGGSFENSGESNVDGVIFSKADLIFDGSGSLAVSSPAGHGIVGKDTVTFLSGTYSVVSQEHGISAKDSLTIIGGDFTLQTGKDGLHGENKDDISLGSITVSGGSFRIQSQGDGVSASTALCVSGGDFTITAGGGSGSRTAATSSTKGIKAADVTITQGVFHIDSADDAIHGGNVTIDGGSFTLSTGDDGIHADETLSLSDGQIQILTSYEGLEGQTIHVSGGYVALKSSDDGINAAGGADGSGFGGFFGGDRFGGGSASLTISGGTLLVNAGGDGLDANGTLTVSGGQVYVSGPTNSGNGALDYDAGGTVTGGTILAAGSAGMSQNFSQTENQGSILVSTGAQNAGTEIAIRDGSGNVLAQMTAEKSYDCVVISCPGITVGGTYTVTAGTFETQITMTSTIYGGGMGGPGGTGGPGGGKGGFGRP